MLPYQAYKNPAFEKGRAEQYDRMPSRGSVQGSRVMFFLLSSRRGEQNVEAGVPDFRATGAITVAAQRWNYTSFHLDALGSRLEGRLNKYKVA